MCDGTHCTSGGAGGGAGTGGSAGAGGSGGTGAGGSGGGGNDGGMGATGAGGAGGSSNGDPHLITMDQLAYDFQGAGEFVLAASRALIVQVRQKPIYGTPVSIQTAVAVRVNGDRVGIYLPCVYSNESGAPQTLNAKATIRGDSTSSAPRCSPTVRVNGVQTGIRVGASTVLGGGALIARLGSGYELTTRDGRASVLVTGFPDALNVRIQNSDENDPGVGLLRSGNGDPHDDIVTRDGVILIEPVAFLELYKIYGESWRIRPSESLFDYAPGESTETFTDRLFPPFRMIPAYLTQVAGDRAEQACRSRGVATGWLASCTLDVALTGNLEFASGFLALPNPTWLQMTDDAESLSRGADWAEQYSRASRQSDCGCSVPGLEEPGLLALISGTLVLTALTGRRLFRRRKTTSVR